MKYDDALVILDDTAAVNYMVWDSATQWVSFDTNVTFQQKIKYANDVCLGGLMIWSLDQDTYDWQALSGLLNKEVASGDLLTGGSMSDETAKDLATLYSAYTGTDCYVSDCVDVNKGQCKSGYSVLEYVHSASLGMIEDPDKNLCKVGSEDSKDAQYRLICCPTDAMPEGCRWEGGSDDGSCTGGGTCGKGTYELVADSYADRTGYNFCTSGKRSLCCNTDSALEKCDWTTCGNVCASDMYTFSMETNFEGTRSRFHSFCSHRALYCVGRRLKSLDLVQGKECNAMSHFCCPSEGMCSSTVYLSSFFLSPNLLLQCRHV